jgi:hypothetical protein
MSMRYAFMLGVLVCAGCVSVDDNTPSSLPRRKDNRYTFTVQVEGFGTVPRSVSAAVGASEFPLTDLGAGRWQGSANLGACVQGFQLRYLVRYPTTGTALSTAVEPPGATATAGGLLKWVQPEPTGLPACARPSVYRVNSFDTEIEGFPGDGICDVNPPGSGLPAKCTFAAAMQESNTTPGPATIELPAGSHRTPDTLYTRDDVVLQGLEPGVIIVSHLSVSGGVTAPLTVELRDLTILGGVRATGSLRLTNVSVLDNHSSQPFGVRALGHLVIERSTISGNWLVGVELQGGGKTRITDSLIANNGRTASSGGPPAGGVLCSTTAGSPRQLEFVNSTITGNRGTFGGVALGAGCSAKFKNVTLVSNQADSPSPTLAAAGLTVYTGGSARLANTILADNVNTIDPANPDCSSGVAAGTVLLESLGHNLIQRLGSCRLDDLLSRPGIIGLSAALGPLSDNGGPTQTRLPLPVSPALGAGSPDPFNDASDAACTHADQRGVLRSGACDIGAVQVSP